MSSAEVIQVNPEKALLALRNFRLSLQENEELMDQIGAYMWRSIRHTFRDEGVPARSWAPLAPSTIRSDPKKYGPGHKLLVKSGHLLTTIKTQRKGPGFVEIGSDAVYAAVQNYGSRDRSFGVGPRTAEQEAATVHVKEHERTYRQRRKVAWMRAADKNGRMRTVRKKVEGPLQKLHSKVSEHEHHQNIPARPFIVFRPEDMRGIHGLAVRYVNSSARRAGLELGS